MNIGAKEARMIIAMYKRLELWNFDGYTHGITDEEHKLVQKLGHEFNINSMDVDVTAGIETNAIARRPARFVYPFELIDDVWYIRIRDDIYVL